MLATIWTNKISHPSLVGIQNGTATLKDSLAISSTKQIFTTRFSSFGARYLPRGVENLCLLRNLHMEVYSSFFYNCQNLEVIKMSSNTWTDKLWYIKTALYKRNELFHEKTWRNRVHITKWQFERLQTVWFELYDIVENVQSWRQWKDQSLLNV